MKRLLLLGALAVLVVVLAASNQFHTITTRADTPTDAFTPEWDVQFCDTFTVGNVANTCVSGPSSVTNGAKPTYVSHLAIQPAGGAPAQGFFDLATTAWTPNLSVGTGLPIGAIIGENSFTIDTNTKAALVGSDNLDPATGAEPRCGDAGTSPVVPTVAPIYNAAITPTTNATMTAAGFDFTKYVQSFDDDNNNLLEYTAGSDPADGGDTLPQTQAPDPLSVPANSLQLGVTHMPDFVPRLLNAVGLASVLTGRGYTTAVVVAGTAVVDVNFLSMNLQAIGAGYLSITTIGVIDPAALYNPATAGQNTLTCAPFSSATVQFGVAQDNPATTANEAGGTVHQLNNALAGGATVDYFISISTSEDYDGDGVAFGIDRCNSDPAAGLVDLGGPDDGDMVTGSCDIVQGAIDNCPAASVNCGAVAARAPDAGSFMANTEAGNGCAVPYAAGACLPNGSLCVSLTPVNGFEGGAPATKYKFALDQDVDCDGAANWADNCPTTYNPSQKDSDGDGVGDPCDPKPALGNAYSGVPMPAVHRASGWVTMGHDHDVNCNDPITIGGGGEVLNAGWPTTSDATCVESADSNDNGSANNGPTLPNGGGGLGQKDTGGDSDHDGVSDYEESNGDGKCDGNPLVADSVTAGTLDGAKIEPVSGLPCWKYDAVTNGSAACGAACNPFSAGSPDSDNDGCSNKEEAGANTALGGNRDALFPYDFTDVPSPATGGLLTPGTRGNKSVTLVDVGVVLAYVGKLSTSAAYQADNNGDGIPDGLQLDFTPAGGGHLANAPNGSITLQDVGVVLAQVGAVCVPLP